MTAFPSQPGTLFLGTYLCLVREEAHHAGVGAVVDPFFSRQRRRPTPLKLETFPYPPLPRSGF